MRWNRVRGTPPNTQSWESGGGEPSAANAAPAEDQLRHAQEQQDLANAYPGRRRDRPRAKVINFRP